MKDEMETPEEMRERLRQEEMKKPYGSLRGSNLADLVGGLSWKFSGIVILLLIILLIALNVFL